MSMSIRLDPADNVVTATRTLEAGTAVEDVVTGAIIPRNHKLASRDIAAGEAVRKYAQVIGYATEDIAAGGHVHTRNVEFRNTEAEYEFVTDLRPAVQVAETAHDTFMGYRRETGRIGILTSVNCSATAARMIASAFKPEEMVNHPNVDGVVAFVYGTGCGMAGQGEGFEALQRVMWGCAHNPNHGGVLMVGLIGWWQDYTARDHGSMDNNPGPGNKKGGLTTILEKSPGAAAKGGTTPLTGVYKYAEPVTVRGFAFMDSPGYDPASVTGQIASGCNLVTFTTGRGSAFGSKPSPCIKIATNTEMYDRLINDMDINAGAMLTEGQSLEEKGREIYDMLLAVASGAPSKSEAQGLGDYEFVRWQIGATM